MLLQDRRIVDNAPERRAHRQCPDFPQLGKYFILLIIYKKILLNII